MGPGNSIKSILPLLLFCGLVHSLYGQEVPAISDTIQNKISKEVNNVDSIGNGYTTKADSIASSLRNQLDSETSKVNRTLDSLNNLNLSLDEYTSKVDSTYKDFQDKVLSGLAKKYDSLGMLQDTRLSKLDSIISQRTSLLDSILTSNGGKSISERLEIVKDVDSKIPELPMTDNLSLPPGLNLGPDIDIPILDTDVLGKLDLDNASLPSIDKGSVPTIDGLDKIKEAQESISDLSQYSEQAKEIMEGANSIKEGELPKDIDKTLDNQLGKIDAVKELQKETAEAEKLKKEVEQLRGNTPKPEDLKTNAKKKMVDHFVGKEEKLQKDLDDIAKTQLKYRDFADARLLPKRVPNPMKGKPFIERLIPETTFQVYTRQNNPSMDLAFSLGYKISGRISAGAASYRRIEFASKNKTLTGLDIHGYRAFGRVRIIKQLNIHLEYERFVNNDLVSMQQSKSEFGVWQDKVNFGVYYSYPIFKGFRGHALYLYDLMRIKESPNTSPSSIRFGFGYQFKKTDKTK